MRVTRKDVGKISLVAGAVAGAIYFFCQQCFINAPDVGKLGGPVEGLSPMELRKFYAAKAVFQREFTPEEGLGPLFNGRSCFECHGQPGPTGGEGRDVASTGVVRIGMITPFSKKKGRPLREVISDLTLEDVDLMFDKGGPALQRKSITSEFPSKYPNDCQIEIGTVPPGVDLQSMRHAGPLFGFGLIGAIPDEYIVKNYIKQLSTTPDLAGRVVTHEDPLTHKMHAGRFGWKAQGSSVFNFTTEAMNVEMGITTYSQPLVKSASGISRFPECVQKYLPPEANDRGTITNQLTYFQSLLAPPGRGPITDQVTRGNAIFNKLQCAVCHVPEMSTAPVVYVVDPDSPAPKLHHMRISALESKPVKAFSDFLLHQMGPGLADGLPQQGAKGGEWRTTPLWGLRFKKFYLHDGRTTDLEQAITAHGGQAARVAANYEKLSAEERSDLLAFLRSL